MYQAIYNIRGPKIILIAVLSYECAELLNKN